MPNPVVRALLEQQRTPASLEFVVVVSSSPLTVSLRGSVVSAVPVDGLTYSPGGHGVALYAPPALPLVFPI